MKSFFSRQTLLLLGIIGLYTFVLASTMALHEPWRDEIHSWTIAKQSDSLVSLAENTQYEGHPIAWYGVLYGVTQLSRALPGLQFIQFLIALGFVSLFVLKAPFPLWQKLLFVLGYFILFEYGVFARNYAIELCAVFGFCAAFPYRNKRTASLLMMGCLALMMFSNIYGLMMGIVLFLAWQATYFYTEGKNRPTHKAVWISTIVFLGIAALAIYDIAPPADTGFAVKWHTGFSIEAIGFALSAIWDAFVPIPSLTFHFWNTNILDIESESLSLILKSLLSVALLAGAVTSLRHPVMRMLFLAGTAFFLGFIYAKYHGFLRHHGHFFILWVVCLWLDTYLPMHEKKGVSWGKTYLFPILLFMHGAVGIGASAMDWKYPFSMGEQVESYIRNQHLTEVEMVGNLDFTAAGIAGRLDRNMYFPSIGDKAYFMVWTTKRGYQLPRKVMQSALERKRLSGGPVLLILTEPADDLIAEFSLKKLGEFTGSIEASESFYLYLIE